MKQLHNQLQNAGSPILPLKYHKFNTNYRNKTSQQNNNNNIKHNNHRNFNNQNNPNQQQGYIYKQTNHYKSKSSDDSEEQNNSREISLFKKSNNNSRSKQQKLFYQQHNNINKREKQYQYNQYQYFPQNNQQREQASMNNLKSINTDYKNIGHFGVGYQLNSLNSNQKHINNSNNEMRLRSGKNSRKDLSLNVKKLKKKKSHHNVNIHEQQNEDIENGLVCQSPLYLQQHKYKTNKNRNDVEHQGTYKIFRNTQVTYQNPLFNQTIQSQQQSSPKMHRNPKKMHLLSQRSSDGHRTLMNINPNYKYKYKKYKAKYQNTVAAVQQLQALNKSITKSQRQISICYESNIKSLQQIIIDKDRQIQQLRQIIYELECKNQSMQDTKLLEHKLDQFKKQLSDKDSQIRNKYSPAVNSMKESQIQKEKKNLQKQYINLEKKIKHLIKQNDNLSRKLKNALQNSQLYEDMLKEKDNRISKLSEFNSQLCREAMKLKDQIQYENTHDTDRSNLVMTFSKNKLNEKKYQQAAIFDLHFANTSRSQEVEKYLNCIDQQIGLIKEKCSSPTNKKQNHRDRIIKCESQVQFIGDMDMRNRQQFYENQQSSEYLEEIKKLAEKLTQLSKQFSRKTLHQQFF